MLPSLFSAPAAAGGVAVLFLGTCSCRWRCRPPAGRPRCPRHQVVLHEVGCEWRVEAMSWHIIDVTGHGAGNPVIRAEGTGSVRVGKVQPVPVPGIPYP